MIDRSLLTSKLSDMSSAMPLLLLAFAILSVLTAYIVDGNGSSKDYGGKIPETLVFGPIKVDGNSKPFLVNVKLQDFNSNLHDRLAIEILDKDKKSLNFYKFSLWSESDIFAEGVQEEIVLTGPNKSYYLRLRAVPERWMAPRAPEGTTLSHLKGTVRISPMMASSLPHTLLGILALIAAVILALRHSRQQNKAALHQTHR